MTVAVQPKNPLRPMWTTPTSASSGAPSVIGWTVAAVVWSKGGGCASHADDKHDTSARVLEHHTSAASPALTASAGRTDDDPVGVKAAAKDTGRAAVAGASAADPIRLLPTALLGELHPDIGDREVGQPQRR